MGHRGAPVPHRVDRCTKARNRTPGPARVFRCGSVAAQCRVPIAGPTLALLICTVPNAYVAATPPLAVRSAATTQMKFPDGVHQVASGRSIEVLEPLSAQRMTFSASPLLPILDAAFGPTWRDRDAVVFHCADGYQSLVKVQRILRYEPLLAHAIAQDPQFMVRNTDGTAVKLGPYYVIWDNLTNPELRKTGSKGWAYQVLAVESADAEVTLSPAEPPRGSSAEVSKGYEAFKTHCVACHSINGVGGRVGPELNYPSSVTEYIRPEWLQRWILDPTSVRSRTAMPGLPRMLPRRKRIAGQITAYLNVMQDKKIAPTTP